MATHAGRDSGIGVLPLVVVDHSSPTRGGVGLNDEQWFV